MDYRDGREALKEIDKSEWIAKLEDIRKRRILTWIDMAKEIGIGYETLCTFLDTYIGRTTYPATIRKIDEYIKMHEAQERK